MFEGWALGIGHDGAIGGRLEIDKTAPRRLVLADPPRRRAAGVILAISAFWLLVVTPLATAQNGIVIGAIAAVGTLLPLGWGLLIMRRSFVIFDADRKVVEIDRALQPGAPGWTVPFDEIEELFLLISGSSEGGPPGFQPFMATRTGTVQFSLAVFDREAADAALDAAAAFLRDAGVKVRRAPKPRRMPTAQTRPRDG